MKNNKKIMGIFLSIQLSGPKPWKIQGMVEVKIIVKVRIPIDETIGKKEHDRLPDVQVLPLLQAAVEDVRNWEAIMPEERTLLVSLREASSTSDKIVVHPSGKLSLSQKVVPLRMQINKFGKQRPSDHQWFDLEAREASGTVWPKEAEREEWFAPADFREMNDGQKLASKSFVEMPAGMQLKSSAAVQMGDFRQRPELSGTLQIMPSYALAA